MQSCSLEITNYCNHHCLKCLHSKFNKMPRKLGMLSFDKWKYIIDHLYTYEYIGIGGAGVKCAVVISPPDVREGQEDVDESTDDVVLSYWQRMMKEYGDPDTYEETIKEQFKHGEIDILIVCSKLLTGFDAPLTQVLYIDKELK